MNINSIQKLIKEEVQSILKELDSGVGANLGDIAEGYLSAAIVAKMLYPTRDINVQDMFTVIKQLNQNENLSDRNVVKKSKTFTRMSNPETPNAKDDEIILTIGLARSNFKALTNFKFMKTKALRIVNTSIKFANSLSVSQLSTDSFNDPDKNIISVSSVGTEDQKGTKVDIRIEMDGKVVPWGKISLKAGSKQIGQVGKKWAHDPSAKNSSRGIVDLFQALFGVTISNKHKTKYMDAIMSNDYRLIIDAVESVYREGYQKISQKFSNEEEFIEFLKTFARGVRYEAALEEEGVYLVDLSGNDFTTMNFDKLVDIFSDEAVEVTLEVEFVPGKADYSSLPYLNFYGVVDGNDYGKILTLRPKVRQSGEFRHYVQKEHGLAKLITISQ